MCGRFNAASDPLAQFALSELGIQEPYPGRTGYNFAPTQDATVIRAREGAVEWATARWWLVPYWTKEPISKYSMFNARAETVAKSPAFREPVRRRRCALPISGFYEWARLTSANKQAYNIRPIEDDGLLLGGVWGCWVNHSTSEVIESFAIVTTAASRRMQFVHTRQPFFLAPTELHRWIDPDVPLDELAPFLQPRLSVQLEAVPVSSYVNNAPNQGSECIEPVGDPVPVEG